MKLLWGSWWSTRKAGSGLDTFFALGTVQRREVPTASILVGGKGPARAGKGEKEGLYEVGLAEMPGEVFSLKI